MKRWIALLITMVLLTGLAGAATAETTFRYNCELILGSVAEAWDLEYTSNDASDGLTFASMTFNYMQNKIIARDATFQAEVTGLEGAELFATLYQTLKLYKKMSTSALEDSDDLVILLVLKDSEDGTITIDEDNRLEMMEHLKELMIKAGYPADAGLFNDSTDSATDQPEGTETMEPETTETSQPQPSAEQPKTVAALDSVDIGNATPDATETNQAQPKTVVAQETSADEKLPAQSVEENAQASVASAYPDARNGLDWLSYHLTLTDAHLVTGGKLEELRGDLDAPDAHYLAVSFSSPDEDILTSDLDNASPNIHLFRLCDRYGNLYRYHVLTVYYQGIEDEHSSDEYAKSFDLVFEVDANAKPEDFVLYLAGATEPEFFTYGATFSVPDRHLMCEGNMMWLSGYDDGSWLDWENTSLEDNEKPLCLYMVTGNEQLIVSPEPTSNMKLTDAAGNQYGVRRSIVYQRDSFDMKDSSKLTGFYIVFYIPKDSDFSDYSLTVINEAEEMFIPIVAS